MTLIECELRPFPKVSWTRSQELFFEEEFYVKLYETMSSESSVSHSSFHACRITLGKTLVVSHNRATNELRRDRQRSFEQLGTRGKKMLIVIIETVVQYPGRDIVRDFMHKSRRAGKTTNQKYRCVLEVRVNLRSVVSSS